MAVLSNYSVFTLNLSQKDEYQLHIDLAVHIFQSRNQALITHLKNFLVYLVSPLDIEKILHSALEQIAVIDEQSCRWLLQNSDYLLPEIDLIEVTQQMIQLVLANQNFNLERNFIFQNNGKLYACNYVIKYLSSNYYSELTESQNKLFNLIKEELLLI